MYKYYVLTSTIHKGIVVRTDINSHMYYNLFKGHWENTGIMMFEYFNPESSFYNLYREIDEPTALNLIKTSYTQWVTLWNQTKAVMLKHYSANSYSPVTSLSALDYATWLADTATDIFERFVYALKGLNDNKAAQKDIKQLNLPKEIAQRLELYGSEDSRLFLPAMADALRSEVNELRLLVSRNDLTSLEAVQKRLLYIAAHTKEVS